MAEPGRRPVGSLADRTAGGGGSLLAVDDLTVEFVTNGRWTSVIDGISFDVSRSETVGLVGESGSGKTVSALAILGLVGALGGRVTQGSVRFHGEELVGRSSRELQQIRGRRIGMIFQQPTRSLDPAFTVGEQIAETVRHHRRVSRRDAWRQAVALLDRVHIPDAARRARDYPHQFSGGMCQRVMIAIAIACEPELLIADEPTTALDVTVQASILTLLREVQRDTGISILFISHDLGVIADMCHRVVVMYAGHVVERASVENLFVGPRHPYTEGLLGSIPRLEAATQLAAIAGNVPVPGAFPPGCRFAPRCPHVVPERCEVAVPPLSAVGDTRVRCARAAELRLRGVEIP